MFERIRELLGITPEIEASGPSTQYLPVYRPELVDRLRHSHTLLNHVVQRMLHQYARRDFDACHASIAELSRELRSYLLGESAEFSAFMSQRLEHDPDGLVGLRKQRARLRRIAHETHELAHGGSGNPFSAPRAPDFGLVLLRIERTLRECFAVLEEELFELYHPGMSRRSAP
jgi:hypothetical protein